MKFKDLLEAWGDDIPGYSERKELGKKMCEDIIKIFDSSGIRYKREGNDIRIVNSKYWNNAVDIVKDYASKYKYTYRHESVTGLIVFNKNGSIFTLKTEAGL